jgi:hypothetical protein
MACTPNVPSNLRSLHIVFAFVCLEVSCAGRRSRVSRTSISSLIAVFPNQFTTRANRPKVRFVHGPHPRKILTTIDPVACCSKDPTPQLRTPSDCGVVNPEQTSDLQSDWDHHQQHQLSSSRIHKNLSMASSKENTNMNTHQEVTTHVWKKKTASVSGSGSPKDNVHSYGDIGPSRYKPPVTPTNPNSAQGASRSVGSK